VTIETAAWLALLVALVATYLVARTTYRIGKKVVRRASSRLIDRAVDAVLFVLLFRWLDGRKRQPGRPRPAVLTGDDIYLACPLSRWQGDPMACRWCNGLLPEDRRDFCGPQCADEAHENHLPDRARSARRRMDRYACVQCGSQEHLEVDHIDPALGRHREPGCIHHLSNLRTLCGGGGQSCHQLRTNGQHARGELRSHQPRRRRVS
jgi:hypothetical protein